MALHICIRINKREDEYFRTASKNYYFLIIQQWMEKIQLYLYLKTRNRFSACFSISRGLQVNEVVHWKCFKVKKAENRNQISHFFDINKNV